MKSIKLGVLVPLSGLVKLYGQEIRWAAQIACNEVNEAGGLLGSPLELIIEDDGSLPQSAVPAAERLASKHHCSAIIGNLLSNSRIAVANRVAEPMRIPMLNFSFYEGSISGRYFFSFSALPNQQIDKMIPYMVDNFGPKVFFAGNNYEWPRGSIDAAKDVLIRHGGEIVGEEYFEIGTSDFHDLLIQVKSSGADIFVPYAAGSDQLSLLTQFTEMGLKRRMKVVMGHYDEAMVQQLPAEVREGFYSSNTYFMGLKTEENKRYLQHLQNHPEVNGLWPNGNGVLTNFGEGTYLCVHAFAKAVQEAGSTNSEALVKALQHIALQGPQGLVDMDPKTQHAHVNSYLACCRNDGSFKIIQNFGRIAPEFPLRYRKTISHTPPSSKTILPAQTEQQHSQIEITQQILQLANIAVIAINQDSIIINANDCTCRLFGYEKNELEGLNVNLLIPPHMRAQHEKHIQRYLNSAENEQSMGIRGEITGYKKDGSFFPADSCISKFKSQHGTIMIATLRDITGRKKEQEHLLWQATHDPLTKLPNRLLILERLENALSRARRSGNVVAVMFIDIDEFKLVNDNHNHETGDQLLIKISQRLLNTIRPGDTAARFGGDEFVILCDKIDHSDTLPQLAIELLNTIKEPIVIDEISFYPTASIGISMSNGHNNTHDLLRNADAAMYQVKADGRDGWQIFDAQIQAANRQQLDIVSGLRQAINNNELRCYMQPIVELGTHRIIGAEALIRWQHNGVFISPAVFIPIAEKSGTIESIGQWIFTEACRQQAHWQSHLGDAAPYISINLSARQLQRENLVEEFLHVIEETKIQPQKIVLEITETTLMCDVENATRILKHFGEHEIRLAIDDFGTGHSSLSRINQLPVTIIKVDQAFIRNINKDHSQHTITSAVIDMAHRLQLKVTAEGVEKHDHLEVLNTINCDNVQGYYFSRPIPAEEFNQLLIMNRSYYPVKKEDTSATSQH